MYTVVVTRGVTDLEHTVFSKDRVMVTDAGALVVETDEDESYVYARGQWDLVEVAPTEYDDED